MQMPISDQWESVQDYEKSLKHKYAQRFRKLRQAWASLTIKPLDANDVARESEAIFSLYSQVTEHQQVRMGLLSKEFIPVLKNSHPEKLAIWGIYEGDKMIAFTSAWVQEDSYDMFYIGFDYERNNEFQLYFNILFFAIEQAILLKKSELILGRTALEAKARLGCRPVYLNTFLHIRNPMLWRIVAMLQSKLGESGTEWEQRHPFKPGSGS